MRPLLPLLRAAILGSALLPAAAGALGFQVQGTVTKVDDSPPMDIAAGVGDPVVGTFLIDPAAPACAAPGSCLYSFQLGPIAVAGSFDGAVVTNRPPGSEDVLLIADFDADVPGLGCSGDCALSLEFRDASGTALASDDLEAALLALPTWPGTVRLLDAGNFTTFDEIQAGLDTIAQAPGAAPVPALPLSWLLVCALGATGLWGRSRPGPTPPS